MSNAVITKKETKKGSIAQLVQSVCLTSRGSGVRLPLLPPPERAYSKAVAEMRLLFCCILPPYLEIRGRENRILLSGKKYSGPKGLYAGKIS